MRKPIVKKFGNAILSFDIFKQGVSWRVNEDREALGSSIGLLFTSLVMIITVWYFTMRFEVL